MYTHTQIYIYIYIYIYILYTYIYIYILYTFIYIYIYVYKIHMYIKNNIYVYIYIFFLFFQVSVTSCSLNGNTGYSVILFFHSIKQTGFVFCNVIRSVVESACSMKSGLRELFLLTFAAAFCFLLTFRLSALLSLFLIYH